MWAGRPLYGCNALAGEPYARQVHIFLKARVALSGASLFSSQYEFLDELILTAVLFTNTLIQALFLITRIPQLYTMSLSSATIISGSCSFRLVESATIEKVRLSPDVLNRRNSSSALQTLRSALCRSRPIVHHSAHSLPANPASPPSIINSVTANTDRAVFDTLHHVLSAPSRTVNVRSISQQSALMGTNRYTVWCHSCRAG